MLYYKNLFTKKIINFFLVSFLIINTLSVHSQTNSDRINNYNWFDSKIGIENTGIYNGIIYKEKFRTVKGNHKFYLTSQFINGNIIYNGQPYFNVEMKYDIYEDLLIIKLPDDSEYSIIQLMNDKIDEFSINNHKFLKISEKYEKFFNEAISGFYEISYQSKHLNLLKKHIKSRKERIVGNFVYSKFKDESEYIIFFNDEYYKINSKKYLIKLFPKLKKDIKKFYNFNKQLQKLDQDKFMTNLIEHISSLINIKGTSN
jgi:hypothetical protein